MRDDSALALLAAVLLAGSCATEPEPEIGLVQPVTGQRMYYLCESGLEFSVQLHDPEATAYLEGRTLSLPRDAARSGVRYGDGSTVLSVRGDDARIEEDFAGTGTAVVHDCRTRAIPERYG